jgi:hypothetical protein
MFLGLGLFLVLVDDFAEDIFFLVNLLQLPHDVHGAHEDLVQMTILHQIGIGFKDVFKQGPNFSLECLFTDAKAMTQVVQPHMG